MLGTLKSLGDDWHNPHPYEKLILSILPNTPYKLIGEIERFLLAVYEAEHYDFKIYKEPVKRNLHDMEVSICEEKVRSAAAEAKREYDLIENLTKRLEETYQEQRKHGFLHDCEYDMDEGEQDEEEEKGYKYEKDVRISNKQSKQQAKGEAKKKKDLEKQLATSVKNMQASLDTSTQKYRELQEEVESLELKKNQAEKERDAVAYFSTGFRRLVLDYEKTKDVEELVVGLKNILLQRATLLKA